MKEQALICPKCDVIVERDDETGKYFCDLCERYFDAGQLEAETVYKVLRPLVSLPEKAIYKEENTKIMRETIPDLEWCRITPWAGKSHKDFMVETDSLNDSSAERVLSHIERDGICLIRIEGQSPSENVVNALAKYIGTPCEKQNTYTGRIKRIRPQAEGLINSGDTTADLGLHVDATQHVVQPAILIFQYITGAKIGGDRVFVDFAKVLLDIPETRRYQILMNLAKPDAAEFNKREMRYVGSIFSVLEGERVACRIRFDEVIKVHPECQDDYQYLKEKANEEKYRSLFRPREGDIVIFDNWRLLHARDEIIGLRQRDHLRMWIDSLKQDIRPRYYLGIRPVPLEILMQIKRMNQQSNS